MVAAAVVPGAVVIALAVGSNHPAANPAGRDIHSFPVFYHGAQTTWKTVDSIYATHTGMALLIEQGKNRAILFDSFGQKTAFLCHEGIRVPGCSATQNEGTR